MTAAVCGGQELTADFLTRALTSQLGGGAVAAVEVAPVGTGQVSDSYRLSLTYDGPAALPPTIIAKVPAADAASRNAARAFRTYEIEASFYSQLAPGLPVSLAGCYYSAYDAEPDEYVVLLEDLAPALPGDQLAGLQPDDAAAAVRELAALHGRLEQQRAGRAALAEQIQPGGSRAACRRHHRSVPGLQGALRRPAGTRHPGSH